LSRLPEDFLVLNRVRLPDATLTNGERELDFVVAGPTGLWVIEVKNTPGHVRVQPDQKPLAAGPARRLRQPAELERHAQPHSAGARAGRRAGTLAVAAGRGRAGQALIVLAHPEVAIADAERSPVPVLVRHQVSDAPGRGITAGAGPSCPGSA
jgi:hypothetical protein